MLICCNAANTKKWNSFIVGKLNMGEIFDQLVDFLNKQYGRLCIQKIWQIQNVEILLLNQNKIYKKLINFKKIKLKIVVSKKNSIYWFLKTLICLSNLYNLSTLNFA